MKEENKINIEKITSDEIDFLSSSIMINILKGIFEREFSTKGCRAFFSPGRINLIGEHLDYNGGHVMPYALNIGIYALAKKNDLGKLRMISANRNERVEIDLKDLTYDTNHSFGNYIAGMAKYIGEIGYKISGIDLAINADLPASSGLSSSAALEMLAGKIFNDFFADGKVDAVSMTRIGQRVENEYMELSTGIMDQFAVNLGKKDNILILNSKNLDYSYVKFDQKDASLVIINSNKKRDLLNSDYNNRASECKRALEILKQYADIEYLCDIKLKDSKELLEKIEEEKPKKRAKHTITEQARVEEMIDAINKSDLEKIGDLLNKSHLSLREDFEVTGEHLDLIWDLISPLEGVYGLRMTGAGFGGCLIALIKTEKVENVREYASNKYLEKTGLELDFMDCKIADGPREIVI